jgi:hypothetical protein
MTLRSSRPSSSRGAALDYEIAQEQASALGRLGRALEAALAALSEHDRKAAQDDRMPSYGSTTTDCETRARLVREASEALWCFMVQRESCGLRDPRSVIRDYQVPAEVQNRMGIFAAPPARVGR